MKTIPSSLALIGASIALLANPAAADRANDVWSSYLDYAYVYSSADAEQLEARLAEYGREAGVSLADFITEVYEGTPPPDATLDEAWTRRRAIAYLLDYLSRGEPDSLDASVAAVRELEDQLGRFENRYWYHYVLAHRALEKGHHYDFVGETLDLWLKVVVPIEAPYESLQTLSLSESDSSGFVAALPYVYENVARLVLIRSQQMGMDRELDPLGTIVRLLGDRRVGAHPDVIPHEASSKQYLDRIVSRLDGPESDAGSLTFTLALFEASRHHDRARSLLAGDGFTAEALEAIRQTGGAYETALDRAHTEQGRAAVYTRVLRQLGELFAARQRLEADPEIDLPFTIEGAIEVYENLAEGLSDGGVELGYARHGATAYREALRGLWEEIQEATLNGADYYLARALAEPHASDEHARNAARLLSRYLGFFAAHATEEGKAGVPESAYFAAHEAARGIADAYLAYAVRPTRGEVELATKRYRNALELFPFDQTLWPALTRALERQGRETEYLGLIRPVTDWVGRSRSVAQWIEKREASAATVATLRRGLGDTQVLMYLGFAENESIPELEAGLEELRGERFGLAGELAGLTGEAVPNDALPAANDPDAPPVASGESVLPGPHERAARNRRVAELSNRIERLDKQIAARARALPLYASALETEPLIPLLRGQRDHPVHTLLRRMYHERRARGEQRGDE